MTKDQENNIPEKSKSQLRAERREKQEAQRAAKAGVKNPTNDVKPGVSVQEKGQKPKQQQSGHKAAPPSCVSNAEKPRTAATESQSGGVATSSVQPSVSDVATKIKSLTVEDNLKFSAPGVADQKHVQHTTHTLDISSGAQKQSVPSIHPAFHQLGLKIASGALLDSDAQCVAMIEAFKMLINEYHPPSGYRVFSREIENAMKPCLSFVSAGRPLPPSLASLVKQFKYIGYVEVIEADRTIALEEDRKSLIGWFDDFLEQKITLSTKAICLTVAKKLRSFKETPIILTYSYSSIIEEIFLFAHKNGVLFEVIVVDSLPQKQGQNLLRRLVELGVKCRYVLINGLTHVVNDANLMLLGADGLLANGSVVCTFGGSQVAMVAKQKNIPVLIACQTYKFCEKVQTGTLEIGWPGKEVMPSDFVAGVVTELRMLPCSAVPAVLRVKQLLT